MIVPFADMVNISLLPEKSMILPFLSPNSFFSFAKYGSIVILNKGSKRLLFFENRDIFCKCDGNRPSRNLYLQHFSKRPGRRNVSRYIASYRALLRACVARFLAGPPSRGMRERSVFSQLQSRNG